MDDGQLLAAREAIGGPPSRPWVGVTREGWIGPEGGSMSDGLRLQAGRVLHAAAPALDEIRPEAVNAVAALLAEELGPLRFVGGPVYEVPAALTYPTPAGATILSSSSSSPSIGGPGHTALLARRPLNWDVDEWAQLLRGDLGPWAMALVDERVVAICHSPAMGDNGVECGTWTHPDYRGRGLAPATVAAWAPLVAGGDRVAFYSTNDDNVRSQRVAEHLGLRFIGRRWPFHAAVWTEGDAWGRALDDHYRGVWVPTPELETDTGDVGQAMHPEWFFRTYDEWDWWDRELLPLVATGPVLDLGAGAGRASLWLQDRGFDVTAVDASPGAVAVCSARGVRDARAGDLNDPPTDRPWRAILLLCGNLGLGGSWEGNRRLLTRLAAVSADDAVLIGDTVEPRRAPEIGLRIRYRGEATPWWRQYNIPVAEMAALVDGTGWRLDRHIVDGTDHAVLLRK